MTKCKDLIDPSMCDKTVSLLVDYTGNIDNKGLCIYHSCSFTTCITITALHSSHSYSYSYKHDLNTQIHLLCTQIKWFKMFIARNTDDGTLSICINQYKTNNTAAGSFEWHSQSPHNATF